jgi:hypothetical protein
MKAARYYGPRDLRIETVPDPPPPGPEEVCIPSEGEKNSCENTLIPLNRSQSTSHGVGSAAPTFTNGRAALAQLALLKGLMLLPATTFPFHSVTNLPDVFLLFP